MIIIQVLVCSSKATERAKMYQRGRCVEKMLSEKKKDTQWTLLGLTDAQCYLVKNLD